MVSVHATQDVVEHRNRFDDPRALVQHHALGVHAHRRIGDLRPRGATRLGELIEDLRGPDDGDVRRLAEPQDLFLNLGETLIAALNGKIATRAIITPAGR
jgi:hypothetical protein